MRIITEYVTSTTPVSTGVGAEVGNGLGEERDAPHHHERAEDAADDEHERGHEGPQQDDPAVHPGGFGAMRADASGRCGGRRRIDLDWALTPLDANGTTPCIRVVRLGRVAGRCRQPTKPGVRDAL